MRSFFLVSALTLSFSSLAFAKDRLELSNEKSGSTAELRKRIRKLQEAVIDLQERVDQLEGKSGATGTAVASGDVTCFIETPFDGLFDATAPTETKARIEAAKACMAKVKSRIHCSAEKVKCGQ
ncbi:MAG: hypothetical protein R3A80_02785 [Bdellovibrionota bacterium]